MLLITEEQIRRLVSWERLVDCLEEAFRGEYLAPPRQVMKMPWARDESLFLIMPTFDPVGGAVKLSTVCPGNEREGLPTIQAVIVVFSQSGTPVAVLDGTILTKLRTAAASALASRYLSRRDSSSLAIIGTGALAPMMAAGHCAIRPISRVSVCGRRPERVATAISAIRAVLPDDIEILAANSVQQAVATADIVSCATSSVTPLLAGKWLRPGTFVDAVGSFSPAKRETDDDVVLRSRIFVDTFEGALTEAGDILDPMRRGVIERGRIEGELADLAHGRVTGRNNPEEIILFKSVGAAVEDLAAARLVITAALAATQTS